MTEAPCPFRQQLNAYLLGRLAPDVAEALRLHLPACPRCRELLISLQSIVTSFHAHTGSTAPTTAPVSFIAPQPPPAVAAPMPAPPLSSLIPATPPSVVAPELEIVGPPDHAIEPPPARKKSKIVAPPREPEPPILEEVPLAEPEPPTLEEEPAPAVAAPKPPARARIAERRKSPPAAAAVKNEVVPKSRTSKNAALKPSRSVRDVAARARSVGSRRAPSRRLLFFTLIGIGLSVVIVRVIVVWYASDAELTAQTSGTAAPLPETIHLKSKPASETPQRSDGSTASVLRQPGDSLASLRPPEPLSASWLAACRSAGQRPVGLTAVIGEGRLRHWGVVEGVVFVDGKTVASYGADGVVRLWDSASGRERMVVADPAVAVSRLAAGPGMVACATVDGRVGVAEALEALFDRDHSTPLRYLSGRHKGAVRAVACQARLGLVASAGDDRTVLLQSASGDVLSRFEGRRASALAFSPKDGSLAAGGDGDTVALWDATTGLLRNELAIGDKSAVNGLAFSPDGRSLFAATTTGLLYWNVAKPDKPIRIDPLRTGGAVQVAVAGEDVPLRLAVLLADHGVWSARSTSLEDVTHPENIRGDRLDPKDLGASVSIAFSPSGETLAVGDRSRGLRLVSGDGLVVRCAPDPAVSCAAFAAHGDWAVWGDATGDLWIWEANGDVKRRLNGGDAVHVGGVTAVALSPDGGRRVVSGGRDGVVRVTDFPSGADQKTPHVFRKKTAVVALASNGDGKILAFSTADGWSYVVDLVDGRELWSKKESSAAACIALSLDGSTLVTASAAKAGFLTVHRASGPSLQQACPSASPTSLAFLSDGGLVVSGKDGVVGWSSETSNGPLFLHTSAVNSVACSPDGSALIWCAADGAVGFSDRKQKTNRTIAPLCPPAGVVRWAAFAKDGYFMTLNSNDTLTVLRRGE